MAKTMKCPDCGGKVSVNATTCPHCGAPATKPPLAQRHFSLGKTLLVIIAAWVVIDLAYESDAEKQAKKVRAEVAARQAEAAEKRRKAEADRLEAMTPEQRAKEQQRKAEAKARAATAERNKKINRRRLSNIRILAERAIKAQLKSPSTADFSGYGDTVAARLTDGGEDKYIVKGYVDAQNAFGATIRERYEVVIEFEPGSDDSSRIISAELYN